MWLQESWLLISADYSQIELRLMAHFSEDASLISLLRKPDGDVFIMMAARWTGKNESEITEKQRDLTKKLVYVLPPYTHLGYRGRNLQST
jgi:DNA polymerase theta